MLGSKGGESASLIIGNSAGGVDEGKWVDALVLEVFVVLQLIVLLAPVVVWWTLVLVERRVGLVSLARLIQHLREVVAGEDTVVWVLMVRCSWLEVVSVRELGRVRVSQPQVLLRETVVNTVAVLAVQEAEHVVLDHWVLGNSGVVGTGGLETDSVTEGEHVLELVVLQGVLVDVHHAVGITETGLSNDWGWLGGWVDAASEEVLLNDLTRVNILHHGDLLALSIALDLSHFPAEVDLDSTLVALVKSNLVGVWELVDHLVWSPVLDTGTWGSTTKELVSAEEVLVVKSVEVTTLSLVWESWRVAHQVSHEVVPSIEEVAFSASWAVGHVNESVLRVSLSLQLSEAWDVIHRVGETWGQNQSLVGEGLAVGQVELVGHWVNLGDLGTNLHLGPVLNLGRHGARLDGELLEMGTSDGEVQGWLDVLSLWGNNGHLQLVVSLLVLLNEFTKSSSIDTTNKNDIKIGLLWINWLWLGTTASKATEALLEEGVGLTLLLV
jgi:hypothetical protein